MKTYILLCEVAQKVVEHDYLWAERDDERNASYNKLLEAYRRCGPADAGDMSERLLIQVDKLVARFRDVGAEANVGEFTEVLFKHEIRSLSEVVGSYLRHKEEVWVLVDNLDKAWPTLGASDVDILARIMREGVVLGETQEPPCGTNVVSTSV